MMINSFVLQIVMAVLSAGILFFYVHPTFSNIGTIQDSIVMYQTETAKVSEVNARLASLVSRVNSINTADMRALMTYMPDTIDDVAITRDIFFISEEAGIFLKDIKYQKIPQTFLGEESAVTENTPERHGFALTISGTYEDAKEFLSLLEQNNYPLEVHEMNVTVTESGLLDMELLIVTYSQTVTTTTI
jgi:hypothetical protein